MTPVAVNTLVVVAYFAVTLWAGERFGRGQRSVDDYFLAGRRISWWSASLSIVGTETSTLTFVGVPALAYAGDMTFLQVALGYVLGRVVVAWWLVPAYYAGRVRTAYELLERRFGARAQRLGSLVFLVSRCLADGVRLFATALVVQALLPVPLWGAIAAVTAVTLVYTLRGGLRAVIYNDAIQLGVYMAGALLAAWVLLERVPGGAWEAARSLAQAGKLRWLDPTFDWQRPYTLAGGLVGGAVLTMATHGTDQMFVQRLLACGSARAARRAVVTSGFLVLLQMALFLGLGGMLFVFYRARPPLPPFAGADEVFPRFIAEQLPIGVGGLVIAAVFAAAMSTLSSSMSSLASSSTFDLRGGGGGSVAPAGGANPARQERDGAGPALGRARRATLAWAVALALVAGSAQAWGSVLEAGLTITSVTFGGVLGIFLVGLGRWRLGETSVACALGAGVLVAVAVQQRGWLAWTWLTPLGAAVTVIVALLLHAAASLRAGAERG